MKIQFLVFMLLINLLLGGALGFLLTVYPSPEMPPEFIDLAITEQSELAKIDADIVSQELSKFESEALAMNTMLKEIFQNRSFIPNLPPYYHDISTIFNLGLSIPPNFGYSQEYLREIAYGGSSYHVSPDAFLESYRGFYLNQSILSDDPLTKIDNATREEILLTSKLDHVFQTLFESTSENTWLSFASEKGYTRNYPWTKLPKLYDARDESWYSSATTGAKDIVILLDKSGSMENERREGAINATIDIISDLGGRDRFNIIGFSDRISQFSDGLELSSEDKLEEVRTFLDRMVSGGTTDYELAFEEGLDVLSKFGSDRREPIVVFITDGEPTIGASDNVTLIERVQQLNIGVNAEFVFFGLGEAPSDLLTDISTAMDGNYQFIQNSTQIQSAISNYQSFLSLNQKPALTWSLPRIDNRDQGLLLTVSYPVIVEQKLRGVVAVDISIDTLINSTRLLTTNDNEYSYVFDLAGTNIIHPDVNISTSSIDEIRQPISTLENPSDTDLFDSMIREVQTGGRITTQILDFQGDQRVVSFSTIGNTSLIYGLVTPLDDFIPAEVDSKLSTVQINQFSFLPGIGLGILGALVIFVLRNRLVKEDVPPIVDAPDKSLIVEEEEAQ